MSSTSQHSDKLVQKDLSIAPVLPCDAETQCKSYVHSLKNNQDVLAASKVEAKGTVKNYADTSAVIVAGGLGLRFGDPRGKQYVDLCELPLISWSLLAFDAAPSIGKIIVVCAKDKAEELEGRILNRLYLKTPLSISIGGKTRQESSFSGVFSADQRLPYVAVHDAARPLIEVETIEKVIADLREHPEADGAIAAHRVSDTLKLERGLYVESTPDRSHYWAAQTPQVFDLSSLKEAHVRARRKDFLGTDDASLIEWAGGIVRLVACPRDNIKLTLPEDYYMAEALLHRRLMINSCGDINPSLPDEGVDSTCE